MKTHLCLEARVSAVALAPRLAWSNINEVTSMLLKRQCLSNALAFSGKGRYVMFDSSTAGAARRPLFIS
jgi:hypothetical protein